MKIRNGFVSNSSSSSFIILFRSQTPCEHCGIRLDIEELLSHYKHEDTEIELNGSEEFMDDIEGKKIDYEHFGHPSHYMDYIKEYESYVKEALKPENKDRKLMRISIDHHDQFTQNIFDALIKKGDIIVLNDWVE